MSQIEEKQIFNLRFSALTGNSPFNWQERLYRKFVNGEVPAACDIPTGLGKTSVIAIWLIALSEALMNPKNARRIPLRLVYVVDRRVVVDQSTDEAEEAIKKFEEAEADSTGNPLALLAQALRASAFESDGPLIALSSLRGQRADNREWCLDPSRPAIVVGTVDMIGSRLLFSGYGGVGKNHQSLQAGLLGQDALILVDEAHLSPSFVTTLSALNHQVREYGLLRPFAVMQLSATIPIARNQQVGNPEEPLFDQQEECKNEEANRRLNAKKLIEWVDIGQTPEAKEKERKAKIKELSVAKFVERAKAYEGQAVSVVIFVSTVNFVNAIAEGLIKEIGGEAETRILRMTGEMRGLERDLLAESEKFKAFLPHRNRDAIQQTRYLIATSCAEVGVNLDADHGICDLTSLDSMIQRIGRINRFGRTTSAISVIVDRKGLDTTASDLERAAEYQQKLDAAERLITDAETRLQMAKDKDEKKAVTDEVKKAKEAKKQIESAGVESDPEFENLERADHLAYFTYRNFEAGEKENERINASPLALRRLPAEPRAWPVPPVVPPLDVARIDDWSMTSLKQKEYPRPLVAYWLRGVMKDDSVQTTFVWRADLDYATSAEQAAAIASVVPVAQRERAVVATFRAEATLKELARQFPDLYAVILDAGGEHKAQAFQELVDKKNDLFGQIAHATVFIPLKAGGLDTDGNVLEIPSKKPIEIHDAVNQDEWSRFVLTRRPDSTFDCARLQNNGKTEAPFNSLTLRDALKDCANASGGLCVNAKELQQAIADGANQTEEEPSAPNAVFIAYFLSRASSDRFLREDDDLASLGLRSRTVDEHDGDVARYAIAIARKIGLDPEIVESLGLAGAWHDRGKNREWWQAAIGNPSGSSDWQPLAKSTHNSFDHSLNQYYRHEFGSLVEARADETIRAHPHCDLILHLIAAHHGYARPHFPARAYDRNQPKAINQEAAADAMQRFARLQRRYGWWQLAYLEAVLKAADALASRDFSRGEI